MVTAALLMVMPLAFSSGIEVGGGVAVIDVADLVLGAAEVEDALRGGGFAGVHVRDDADVAKFFEHGSQRPAANRPPDLSLVTRIGPREKNRFPPGGTEVTPSYCRDFASFPGFDFPRRRVAAGGGELRAVARRET